MALEKELVWKIVSGLNVRFSEKEKSAIQEKTQSAKDWGRASNDPRNKS